MDTKEIKQPKELKETKEEKKKRIRYKEYKCIYPNCDEKPKTKYNCISHIWDGHLKLIDEEFQGVAFKNLPEEKKKEVKQQSFQYIQFVTDEVNIRKRKPYKSSKLYELNENNNIIIDCEDEESVGDIQKNNEMNNEENNYSLQQLYNQQQIIQMNQTNEKEFITIEKINDQIRRLCVCGEIFSEYGFYQRSDQRCKEEIQKINESLHKITQIKGYSYEYKNQENKIKYGFLAQELQKIYPNAVHVLHDETLSIDTVALLPYIVDSLKELHENIIQYNNINTIVNDIIEIDTVLKEVLSSCHCYPMEQNSNEKDSHSNYYILGHPNVIWYTSLFFTIVSFFQTIFIPQLGLIWLWTIVISLLNWISYWHTSSYHSTSLSSSTQCNESMKLNHSKKENSLKKLHKFFSDYRNITSMEIIIRWYIIIVSGIFILGLSFLVGRTLHFFMGIVFAFAAIIVGLCQFKRTRQIGFRCMLTSIVCFIGILIGLICVQPSYTCSLSSNELNEENRFVFIQQQPPWNCVDPELKYNSSSLIVDKTKPLCLKAIDFGENVQIELICKNGISFHCGNVKLMK